MKDQILKIAKVKSEKEFYKKYPTEEAFMKAHKKEFKKAAMGSKMVNDQLHQLTDFGNPPIAQNGTGIIPFDDARTKAQATILGITPEELMKRRDAEAAQANQSSSGGANDIMSQLASFITPEMMAGLAAKDGYSLSKAYDGEVVGGIPSWLNLGNSAYSGNPLAATSPRTSYSTNIGDPAKYSKWTGLVSGTTTDVNGKATVTKAATDKAFGAGKLPAGAGGGGMKGKLEGAGMSALSALPQLIGDVQAIAERKKQKKELRKGVDVSDLVRRAAESRPIYQPNQQIVKPWNVRVQPGELYNSYGSNTNFLSAANGTQIQNTYAPTNTLYDDLGYEPLNESNVKQYQNGGKAKRAQFGIDMLAAPAGSLGSGLGSSLAGGGFKGSPEGNIGSTLGSLAGNFIPIPGAGIVLSAVGGAIGGFIGGDEQRQMEELQNQYSNHTDLAAGQSVIQSMDQQFGGSRRDGGSVGSGYYTPPSAAAMYTDRAQSGRWVKQSDPTKAVEIQSSLPPMESPKSSHIKTYSQLNSNTNTKNNKSKYSKDFMKAIYDKQYYDNQPSKEMYSYARDNDDKFSEFIRIAPEGGEAKNELHRIEARRPFLNLIGKKQSMERFDDLNERKAQGYMQQMNESMPGGLPGYTAPNMEYGGQMAMGGDLQVHEGKADTISYNPFLPNGGETVMFKGPSHAEGGMDISYGQNGVEVEGGEPGVVLKDGGEVKKDESLVIYGNIKFDKTGAEQLGDPKAEGQKIKNYMNDLSKFENKQSKLREKGLKLIDEDDLVRMGTVQAIDLGTTMNFKTAAQRKIDGAAIQEAYNKTAKEYGYADAGKFMNDVRKGSVKKLKPIDDSETAQNGKAVVTPFTRKNTMTQAFKDSNKSNASSKATSSKTTSTSKQKVQSPVSTDVIAALTAMTAKGKGLAQIRRDAIGTYGQVPNAMSLPNSAPVVPLNTTDTTGATAKNDRWKDILGAVSSVVPMLRPSNAQPLDPSQLSGEMLALASNQLEGVQAQSFQPMLDQPFDISLQDQINMIDAQSNAAIRAIGNDPSAQSQIMANAIEAKNRVLGEEFRMNQANKAGIYSKNRELINQSKLANLQIFDKQYERQSQAKSNTKAQAIGALNSINSKIAQNKLENKQLGVYENLYGYRFGPNGQAYNLNGLAQFNMSGNPFARTNNASGQLEEGYEDLFNTAGRRVATRKSGKNETSRNGSIVKALKSL